MFLIYFAKLEIKMASVLGGWIISFLNVVIGSYVLVKNSYKEQKKFINLVMLSMVIRLFVMLGMVFVGISLFGLSKFDFTISLFLFYIIFLTVELNYISKFFKKV